MKLWIKVFLGLIFGIIVGICFLKYVSYIKPIGDIFLRLIKMIIAPLVFFSLVSGITSMNDFTTFSRVGLKSIAAFLCTTIFAVMFGISVALIMKPGYGIHIDFSEKTSILKSSSFNIIDFFVDIVPDNMIAAFSNFHILQVVFISIFFGVIINKMGTSTYPIRDLFRLFSQVILKMISVIIQFSPYGAFALTAWVVGNQGLNIMFNLSKLVISIGIAMLCQYCIFGFLIYILARVSPFPFYRKSIEYQVLALSTGSSKASLGTTMKV